LLLVQLCNDIVVLKIMMTPHARHESMWTGRRVSTLLRRAVSAAWRGCVNTALAAHRHFGNFDFTHHER